MKFRYIIFLVNIFLLLSCEQVNSSQPIRIISWGGISAEKADTLYSLAKECGFDTHLGLYRAQGSAIASMDAAARAGMGIIISFPQIKNDTDVIIPQIKNHPALVAYHIKDEPDTADFEWLRTLSDKIEVLDPSHPCYINLLPNWSWGVEEYACKIECFANEIDVPFYSFDNYPIIEIDGETVLRPDWYRNLEEFSAMAKRHGRPFWGFALAKSHGIVEPEVAYYPEPTIGQIRLQVFSNLLYGAQAIQYFNFTGLVDPKTCAKLPAFDIVKEVNTQIKAYSQVFAGCNVLGVWHVGESIPAHTQRLLDMPHKKIKFLDVTGEGAVVSLIENSGKTYLAVQNRDCENSTLLRIKFSGNVNHITFTRESTYNRSLITLQPGDITIFQL